MADDATTTSDSTAKTKEVVKSATDGTAAVATQQQVNQAGTSDTSTSQTGSQAFDKSGTTNTAEQTQEAINKAATSEEQAAQEFAKTGTQATTGVQTGQTTTAEQSAQTTQQLSEMMKSGTSNLSSEEVTALVNEARRQGVAETEIPAWLDQAAQGVVGMAQANAQTPTQAYGGQMVAGMTPDQEAFFGQLRDYLAGTPSQAPAAIAGAEAYGAAPAQNVGVERTIDEGGRLGAISDYVNPYTEAAIMPAIRAAQAERDAALNQIRSRQTMGGSAYGDARHGIADAETYDRAANTIGDITWKGMDANWNQAMGLRGADQGRMMQADMANAGFNEAALRRGFEGSGAMLDRSQAGQNQTLEGLRALFASGSAQQENQQKGLDAEREEFLRTQAGDQDKLKTLASIIGGVPYGKKETTLQTDTGSQTGTKTGSQIGATTDSEVGSETGTQTGTKTGTGTSAEQNQQQVLSGESGTSTSTKTGATAEAGTTTGSKVGTSATEESGTQTSQQQTEQHAVETLEKELLGLTESQSETDSVTKSKAKTNSDGTTTSTPADTTTSDLMQLAGTVGAALISDRRVKTDIAEVGRMHDGVGVYRFRYGGMGPFHIGLMADEVEQYAPEAVLELEGGLKAVNYEKATERAAGISGGI